MIVYQPNKTKQDKADEDELPVKQGVDNAL